MRTKHNGLPFTQDAFFSVFARYNTAVWSLILVFYVLGAARVALLFRPSRSVSLFISLALAAIWLVNDVGYRRKFFRAINPAAAVFVLQAGLLILLPLRSRRLRFAVRRDARSAVGLLLVLFAAVIYPSWGWLAGHVWPGMPAKRDEFSQT